MDTFSVRDLKERPGAIIKDDDEGHMSLVTKRGRPIFLAVPFSEDMLTLGLHKHLALQLLKQGSVTLDKPLR